MKLQLFLFFLMSHYLVSAQNDPELFPANDRKGGGLGYFLEDGTNVVKGQFCSATYNIDGYYIVSIAEHEIDENGNENANHIPETEKFGLLNSKGKFIINFEDNYSSINVENKMIVVQKNNLYGVVNEKNKIVIPFEYDEFEIQNQEIIIVKKNNKTAVINYENKIIVPFIYDEIFSFIENKTTHNFFVIAKKKDEMGVVDRNNKIVVPFLNQNLEFITEKLICLKKGEKYRLVDFNLKPFIEKDFKSMYQVDIDKSKIYAEDENYGYYFTDSGKVLKKEKLVKQEEYQK